MRRIQGDIAPAFFKPQGIPLRELEVIELTHEEVEALRLKNVEDLDQTACAKEMGISQSTFQRALQSAYKKVSKAILQTKAIRIREE